MRRTYKKLISLCAVLVFTFTLIPSSAFAQDPFSAVAVGGLGGLSGAGLFTSMAMASGVDITYNNNDPTDAIWNSLNSDHVYFTGEKHEADPITDPQDVYDYIKVDIGDWLDAQSDFIVNYINTNNVTDNSTGTTATVKSWASITDGQILGPIPATNASIPYGNVTVDVTTYSSTKKTVKITLPDNRQIMWQAINISDFPVTIRFNFSGNNIISKLFSSGGVELKTNTTSSGTIVTDYTSWTSRTINTGVFDDYGSAKVSIPTGTLPTNWSLSDFFQGLNTIVANGDIDQIIISDGDAPEPVPIPDTPLGDVPFDDWVDLWGQSIWERLTSIEEKAELMVIGQSDGLDDLDDINDKSQDIVEGVEDLIGLDTDIEEDIDDLIVIEQGISTDVESIEENVEDVEDQVIIIVDEMGNVIDVLEGIEAEAYAQGETLDDIGTDVGTLSSTATAISTELADQTETQEDILEATQDIIPYVAPLPDIATDTEIMVDILPDIKTATETATDTLTDTLPDIKDATDTITETLPDIITEIQDATQTITDVIPQIDDICLNIDEAPLNDLDEGADRIPRFIAPYILDLRSALGIWHYVTEWLAQISTTFAFVTGCLVGTSIMTPIYAAIAGYMCIRVYRRMCE